jgi:hypothetical protein
MVIKSMGMRQAEHFAHMGEMRNAHKILTRKHERKRPLGTYKCGRMDIARSSRKN